LLCRDRALAEELVSEAITRVLRRTHTADIDCIRRYLRRTLVNLVIRDRRRPQELAEKPTQTTWFYMRT
jgi:DNA-directed RNA polymerase specialized sigma24 family protein